MNIKISSLYAVMLMLFSFNFLNARLYQVQNDTIEVSNNGDAILFEDVEIKPVFSGCTKWAEECEQRNCFDLSIMTLIRKNIEKGFATEAKYVLDSLKTKVQFEIDTLGLATNIKVFGVDSILNKYAKKSIEKLSIAPRMKPAIHKNKKTRVLYSVNIRVDSKGKGFVKEAYSIRKDYGKNFSNMKLDNVVIYPGCKQTDKQKKEKQCFSDKVKRHIHKNFNVNIARNLGLSGVNRIYVRFRVSKCGNVIDVQARGPHPDLEEEALRVVKKLPRMFPAKYGDETIGVLFSLPIVFTVK